MPARPRLLSLAVRGGWEGRIAHLWVPTTPLLRIRLRLHDSFTTWELRRQRLASEGLVVLREFRRLCLLLEPLVSTGGHPRARSTSQEGGGGAPEHRSHWRRHTPFILEPSPQQPHTNYYSETKQKIGIELWVDKQAILDKDKIPTPTWARPGLSDSYPNLPREFYLIRGQPKV